MRIDLNNSSDKGPNPIPVIMGSINNDGKFLFWGETSKAFI